MQEISKHLNKHKFPDNDKDFGFYLAGLSESDGYLCSTYYQITFHKVDIQTAFKLKSYLGYGSVKLIKDTNAYYFRVSHKEGLVKIATLLNGKLRTTKWLGYIAKFIPDSELLPLLDNNVSLLDNYWLAGFIDGDGSLQIKIVHHKNKPNPEFRVKLQIDQKTRQVLDLIKYNLQGGYVGFRKTQNTYYYETTNFTVAYNLINYLDIYHLQASK